MKRRVDSKKHPTRRDVVLLLSSAAAAVASGCGGDSSPVSATTPAPAASTSTATGTASCVVRPQQTEGPYFVDEKLLRSDIRTDPNTGAARPGAPLALSFRVSRSSGGACTAFANVLVDVWHCDALGTYSEFGSGAGSRFLRGYQVADASGIARFTTVYPGWYMGRAVHIHFKIRNAQGASPGFEFTSQLYFDESLTDQVHALAPYSSKGRRDTTNQRDGVYGSGGTQLQLALAGDAAAGFATTFDIALQV